MHKVKHGISGNTDLILTMSDGVIADVEIFHYGILLSLGNPDQKNNFDEELHSQFNDLDYFTEEDYFDYISVIDILDRPEL